jgi:hypothetical protein
VRQRVAAAPDVRHPDREEDGDARDPHERGFPGAAGEIGEVERRRAEQREPERRGGPQARLIRLSFPAREQVADGGEDRADERRPTAARGRGISSAIAAGKARTPAAAIHQSTAGTRDQPATATVGVRKRGRASAR